MLHVRCPHCGKSLKAPDKMAGRSVRCPKCGQALKLPVLPAPETTAAPPSVEEASRAAAGATTPAQPFQPQPLLPEDLFGLPAIEPTTISSSGPLAAAANSPGPLTAAAPETAVMAKASPSVAKARPGRRYLYLGFALSLIPLAFTLLGTRDDVKERLERTLRSLESQPEVVAKLEAGPGKGVDGLFDVLPGGRIEGAHLSRRSWVHWLYALASATVFLVALKLLFESGKATFKQVLLIGLCTATFGIFFLICVQWIAAVTQGLVIYGRSIVVIFFYIVKFIGFSYRAALDPETGFWMSFLGFTFGVGLCEELTKALPVMFSFRGGGKLGWRGARMWGLASGVGFGVAEGIMYSSSHYNGVAGGDVYLVRFSSCVALHAVWGAMAGIMCWRRRAWLEKEWEWGDMLATLLWVLAIPMVLHGLYDTLLKKDMHAWALVAALASFAWLVALTEWTRSLAGASRSSREDTLRSEPHPA